MSQERLTGLALISIEHNVRRSLDVDNLVTAFAQAKARKHQFQNQWTCGYPGIFSPLFCHCYSTVNFARAKPNFVLFILFDIIYFHYLIVLYIWWQLYCSFDVAIIVFYLFRFVLFYI